MNRGTRTPWRVLAVAAVAALLLGPVDLLGQVLLPYPWANLANSSAVWALAAFAMGAWVRTPPRLAAGAAALLMVLAVETYHLAAVLFLGNDPANLWDPVALVWMGFGVLAGVVFGLAGAFARGERPVPRLAGRALPVAVLLAEAAILVYRSGNGDEDYRLDSLGTAAIEAVVALAVAVFMGRAVKPSLAVLAVSVPLAVAGFGAFRLAGFGS